MNTENKISALIITKNEAKNIEALALNLDFVDEIVIVDSFSTDRTKEVVKKFPHIRFYQHVFENYAAQRNIALKYATHPWILFIDADERISKNLKKEILGTVNNPKAHDAYFFYRRFYFKEKPMFFTGLQKDKNIRLFRKNAGTYVGFVHEKLIINGSISTLKNKLTHYSYNDYISYKEKLVNYGKLKAREKLSKGEQSNIVKKYLHTSYCFFNRYIMRFGFLDGKKGIVISYLMSLSIWERYREMHRLRHKKQ